MAAPDPDAVNAALQQGAITPQEAQTLLGTGTPPAPPQDAVNAALAQGAITQQEADTLLNPPSALDKAAGVIQDAGSGVLNAAIQTGHALGDVAAGVAGMPADIQGLADKVLPSWMNYHEPGTSFPTADAISNAASNLTGVTFPAPQTGFQEFVYRGAKGGFSVLSPEKWLTVLGILSGLAGQEASNAGHPDLAVAAQALPLGASALSALKSPWDVNALGPWVNRIGSYAINRAGSLAQDAAKILRTQTTNIANQEPALQPLMNWLEQQPTGAPISDLRQVVDNAAGDVLRMKAFPAAGTPLHNDVAGLQDASVVASNAVAPSLQPAQVSFPGITSGIKASSTGGVLPTILNLIPGRGGSMLSDALGSVLSKARIGALTNTLTSPDAASYLNSLGNYSKTNAVLSALAQSLVSLGLQNATGPSGTAGPNSAVMPSPF